MFDIPALLHNIYYNTRFSYSASETLHSVPELSQCQLLMIDSLKEIHAKKSLTMEILMLCYL